MNLYKHHDYRCDRCGTIVRLIEGDLASESARDRLYAIDWHETDNNLVHGEGHALCRKCAEWWIDGHEVLPYMDIDTGIEEVEVDDE